MAFGTRLRNHACPSIYTNVSRLQKLAGGKETIPVNFHIIYLGTYDLPSTGEKGEK